MTVWRNYKGSSSGSKYHSQKVKTPDGEIFDSRKEYKRWCDLTLLERAGEITNLQRQVPYLLIPEQRAPSTEVYKKGSRAGQPKPGPVLERKVVYIADFVYQENGETVVEDTKGIKTKEYIIKRKLLLYRYGIRIKET